MEVIEVTEREVEIIEVIERGPQGVAGAAGAVGPQGPAGATSYTVITSNYTAANGEKIGADTTSSSFTLTLPATPSDGDAIYILDYAGTFDTNNLIIGRNGNNIEGLAEDMTCNVEGSSFKFVYTGATNGWQMIPYYGTGVAVGASASDVLSVTSGEIIADDPNADRIVYWNNTSNKLEYGTPANVGAAAASHTHAASDITSGTLDTARLGSGTASSGTWLRGDSTWQALPAAGSTNLWIPASAWIPRTTNGCGVDSREQATNKINTDELLFDAAAIEYAQATVVMPNNWNAGTITAKFYWTASSGSGDCVWQIAGRALANDDALDQAMGTAQTATDTLTAANDMDISPATSAVTLAGSPASGQLVIYEISRKATDNGDTLAVDARLLGVEISFN